MRFLLIGGTGYIGGRLLSHLKTQRHWVAVTTRRPENQTPPWLQKADKIIRGPIPPDDYDVAIHLAAPDEVAGAKNPVEALQAGTEFTWAVLSSLSQQVKPPLFVY